MTETGKSESETTEQKAILQRLYICDINQQEEEGLLRDESKHKGDIA